MGQRNEAIAAKLFDPEAKLKESALCNAQKIVPFSLPFLTACSPTPMNVHHLHPNLACSTRTKLQRGSLKDFHAWIFCGLTLVNVSPCFTDAAMLVTCLG